MKLFVLMVVYGLYGMVAGKFWVSPYRKLIETPARVVGGIFFVTPFTCLGVSFVLREHLPSLLSDEQIAANWSFAGPYITMLLLLGLTFLHAKNRWSVPIDYQGKYADYVPYEPGERRPDFSMLQSPPDESEGSCGTE